MQKTKLVLSALMLTLALTFAGGPTTTAYADTGGDQGGSDKKTTQTMPNSWWDAVIAAIQAALGTL